MKNLLLFLATVIALSSCSDIEQSRKYRESLKYKKVRAKYVSINNNECIIGRTTVLLDVDTMHRVDDTITYGNYMYVIVD